MYFDVPNQFSLKCFMNKMLVHFLEKVMKINLKHDLKNFLGMFLLTLF
jgi:hypothetical protein